MFRLIKAHTNFDFVGFGRYAIIITYVLIALSAVSLGMGNLKFGIDFTGGAVVQVDYPQVVDLQAVRSSLDKGDYGEAIVQNYGSADSVMIRVPAKNSSESTKVGHHIMDALASGPSGAKLQKVQFVGPQVSKDLFNKGGLALLYTLIGILIYLIFRFHWKLAAGAVIGLIHDLIITVGLFSISGLDFDLTVLAAILAVLGYSVNDTVVVYDRIRENTRRMRKASPNEVVNAAINQTLSRTVITSGVTLLAVLALFFLGGASIHGFAFTMIVGILVGTYSSIFVASKIALWLKLSSRDLYPPKEDAAEEASRSSR